MPETLEETLERYRRIVLALRGPASRLDRDIARQKANRVRIAASLALTVHPEQDAMDKLRADTKAFVEQHRLAAESAALEVDRLTRSLRVLRSKILPYRSREEYITPFEKGLVEMIDRALNGERL